MNQTQRVSERMPVLLFCAFVSDGGFFYVSDGSLSFLSPTASFLSAAKEKRKRNAAKNYVFGFPCAASPVVYHACFHHANAVLCKFYLNVALFLLLFSLPLLL